MESMYNSIMSCAKYNQDPENYATAYNKINLLNDLKRYARIMSVDFDSLDCPMGQLEEDESWSTTDYHRTCWFATKIRSLSC